MKNLHFGTIGAAITTTLYVFLVSHGLSKPLIELDLQHCVSPLKPFISSGVLPPLQESVHMKNLVAYVKEKKYTMSGIPKLYQSLQAIDDTKGSGDFVETGTWRGGQAILARAKQIELGYGSSARNYACDSFQGLPEATTSDDVNDWHEMEHLVVNVSSVAENFKDCDMLDENVYFVRGYFRYSLSKLRQHFKNSNRTIAVLRGDGDMYESYMDILYNLYDFIPVGGIFICDDCTAIAEAMKAIEDFRDEHGISDEMLYLDTGLLLPTLLWWVKSSEITTNYSKYEKWNSTRKIEEAQDCAGK